MKNDIVVLGGGPGGYHAAIRGAQLGAKVTLVEKEKMGGTCLNWGCIPTKALYKSAEIIHTLKHIDEYGISVDDYSVDVSKIQERKQNIIKQLEAGIKSLMKANKIEVVYGAGQLKDKNTVLVKGDGKEQEIEGKNIIIATGSKVLIPPIAGVDTEGILKSKELLNFKAIPKCMTVIGGGVVGIEFASIFNALGSKVTVITLFPTILERMDTDITKRLAASLKKKGIAIHTGTSAEKIEKKDGRFAVFAKGKKGEIVLESEQVLLAAGRKPSFDGLSLENIGIEYDEQGIKVNHQYETNVAGVYAIGDVTGKTMLAHTASHHGITAAENIMGVKSKIDHDIVPNCVFTFPELAGVGLTEQEAKDSNIHYNTSKFMFGANGKALTLGEAEGLVKIISDDKDEIIGVHIMGPHASDLIHEGTLAISAKLKVEDIANTIHAHPTLSETFAETVLGLKGEAIHAVPSRKKG